MTSIPGLKFSTPRNPERPTLGGRQDAFARTLLNRPKGFMPWQRLVADVLGEQVQDDETGLWVPAYSLGVVTVQRQAGKSDLCMCRIGERCMTVPGWRSWYTAQTGGDARDQFLKFADEVVAGTPLEHATRTLRGNGHEVMQFPATKSTLRPYPPTESGVHGKQVDGNDIDEAWWFDAETGKLLLSGSGPAALTRPLEQTVIWSAGGTASSTWLAELVARGRAGDPTFAYFEFGIPDDLPIEGELSDADYQAIAEHHPAYGHTITVNALKKLRAKTPDDAEYARGAGNRWTEVIGGAIPVEQWRAARWAHHIPESARVGYAAARAADGSQVAIAAAALVDDLVVVEILDVLPTAYRAAEHVNGWTQDGQLAVDAVGPSSSLHGELVKLGRKLYPLDTRQVTAATANVLDGLKAGRVKFREHPALDEAVKVATLRSIGDGGKAWARRTASAPIAALEAATLAIQVVTNKPNESQPLIDFGEAS